jgi:hypothetical protein
MKPTRIALAVALAASLNVQANDADILTNEQTVDIVSESLFTAPSHTISVQAPDGRVFQETVSGDSVASIDLIYAFGAVLPEGQYQYSIQPNLAEQKSSVPDNLRGLATEKDAQLPAEPISGAFTVENGIILDTNAVEPTAGPMRQGYVKPGVPNGDAGDAELKAQVFVTDLIVQGSTCSGFDCVNGESFGFDTLRLKENNLRIHFNDTSNSGSFPTADWRLGANDTSNGGQNKFYLEDSDAGTQPFTILQGAGNNALYIDAQGDVGLNTSNPVVELHISDGDSPTVRLEQNATSGFTPQTWDIAGNETNFFIRDVTNGSELPFKILPGADDNSLVIAGNNNIGIGTNNPDVPLHIRSLGRSAIKLDAGANNQADIGFNSGGILRFILRTREATNNFEINRRGANGGFQDTPITVTHDTGEVIIQNGLKLNSSPTSTINENGVSIFFDSADNRLKLRLPNGDIRAVVLETP